MRVVRVDVDDGLHQGAEERRGLGVDATDGEAQAAAGPLHHANVGLGKEFVLLTLQLMFHLIPTL